MSLTDDLSGQMTGRTGDATRNTLEYAVTPAIQKASAGGEKLLKGGAKAAKTAGKYTFQGICLILKGAELTVENVLKKTAEAITGDIRFSKKNIYMDKLKKSGKVTMVNESVTAEAMKYFDQYCKQFGIHYTAMADKRDKNNPAYFLFFNNKDSEIILNAMKLAYKDYSRNAREQPENGKEAPRERESVKAKLAFFRDRAAAGNEEQRDVEKHLNKSEISR